MSDTPPEEPQQFAPYYRPSRAPQYADPSRLQALADGFFGLRGVFLIHALLLIGLNGARIGFSSQIISIAQYRNFAVAWVGALASLAFLTGFLAYPKIKRIAAGKGWSPISSVLFSILIGLSSFLCCGVLLGYMWILAVASLEMKKYGVHIGFGLRRSKVDAQIQKMKSEVQPASFTGFGPPQ